MKTEKGFTLIELLVVIGIIAVLSVVVILTINPAELLRQARDSNRVSDLGTLKSALSLYLTDVSSPNLNFYGAVTNCYTSIPIGGSEQPSTTGICASWVNSGYATGTYITSATSSSAANYRKVDGTGWVPVNFSSISSGAPLGNLPIDPVNASGYFYSFAASSSLTFELDAKMESAKYSFGGGGNVESTDGGDRSGEYEVGTAPSLSL